MNRILLLFISFLIGISASVFAQRPMENLDRGLVAVKVSEGMFLSWRITGQEWYDVKYNVYRGGSKLNAIPLEVSNFTDSEGTLSSVYTVRTVINGIEGEDSKAASVLADQYLEIKMRDITRNGYDYNSLYSLNDATIADLDGDGEMEVIIKRMNTDFSVANDSVFTYFEAYKLDGTFLWAIDCGPNLVSSGHVETNLAAFDFDGDGRAEIVMRTADGTIDGKGKVIGDANANYRPHVNQTANMQYMTQGPEFLSLFDGLTGEEIDRVEYIPRGDVNSWGDGYGHRANKFFFGAPYLDGRNPSVLITRGIYTRIVMRTFDVVDKKLIRRWENDFDTNEWPDYYGQGNHNYTIADVDGDGRDEIVYGSMTVDDDGKGLYSTKYGHGDAIHVGDFDPYHKGIEIFACLESSPHWGAAFRDGATDETFIKYVRGRDCGRCCAGNVTDDFIGAELWAGGNMWSATTREKVGTSGGAENFILYWDGDLLQETFDYTNVNDVTANGYGTPAVFKYGQGNILEFLGTATNNHTKGNPCMQVDIFGDWREELILRTTDDMALRIYTTTEPTEYRNYTLLHDFQYRQAICWQMCGYNQPPHVSYFLGKAENITIPPPPAMTNERIEITSQIDNSGNNSHLLMANTQGGNVSVNGVVSPFALTINTPADYTLTGDGSFNGEMKFVKQGTGTLTFNGNHSYSGPTELWDGTTVFNGTLANSPVWMNRFAELNSSAILTAGLTMEYGAILRVAGTDNKGNLQTGSLDAKRGAIIEFDIYSADISADLIKVTDSLKLDKEVIFRFTSHNIEGDNSPEPGKYLICETSGNIRGNMSDIIIEGLPGIVCSLIVEENNIYLDILPSRDPGEVFWKGDLEGGIWDLATTENFLLNGEAVSFVSGDKVTFTDDAVNKTVTIPAIVYPDEVIVNNSAAYTFQGSGNISGNSTFRKNGTGELTINTTNDYTGKTEITGGTVVVTSLATSQKAGALGAVSSNPDNFTLSNVVLKINGITNNESAITLSGDSAVFDIAESLDQQGIITGETLVKTGEGTLSVYQQNTHKKTILRAGTLKVIQEPDNYNGYFGDTLVIEGGMVQCLHNNNSYSRADWNIVVPENKGGLINFDGRCAYNGSLTGKGTLTVYSPFVRSDVSGDWSKFEGTLKATGNEIRFNNSYGMPLAVLDLSEATNAYNEKRTTFTVGALIGSGKLGGSHDWVVGSANTDCSFSGQINSPLTKVGTATLALSGNTESEVAITVREGILMIDNADQTTSATGKGTLTVKSGATLTGEGYIGNDRIELKSGATFKPGKDNTGKLTAAGIVTVEEGAALEFQLNDNNSVVSLDNVMQLVLNGTVRVILKDGYTPQTGDSFTLWNTEAINAEGNSTLDLPELPAGFSWDTSELLTIHGILKVTGTPDNITSELFNEPVTVSVITSTGTIVHHFECLGSEIHTYIEKLSLEEGVYMMKIDGKEKSIIRKFISKP